MSFIEIDPPAWTPFQRSKMPAPTRKEAQRIMREHKITYIEAKRMLERLAGTEAYLNSRYQVNIIREAWNGFGMPIVHLSIKRLDKRPIHDWRDLQRIKNELLGAEIEAIELYPAESRLVDSANQFHLFAFPAGVTVPVGWTDRYVEPIGKEGAPGSYGQRAMEDQHG
jgi:hypothetical protein